MQSCHSMTGDKRGLSLRPEGRETFRQRKPWLLYLLINEDEIAADCRGL